MPDPTTPAAQGAASSHDTHLPTSTVLVVDDNAQNVELMQAYLETLNCLVQRHGLISRPARKL